VCRKNLLLWASESVRRQATVSWRCRKQKPWSHPTPTAATTTGSSASSLRQRHKLGLNMSLFLLQLGEGRPLRMPQRPAGSPGSSRESVLPWTANNAETRINNRLLLTKTSCKAMTLPVTRQETAAGEPCSLHKRTWKGSRITSNLAKKKKKEYPAELKRKRISGNRSVLMIAIHMIRRSPDRKGIVAMEISRIMYPITTISC